MGVMQIEVDKKALAYTLELLIAAGIISVSGHFIMRDAAALLMQSRSYEVGELPPVAPADENLFYIEPPGDKPVFLTKEALLKKREALVWEERDFVFADLRDKTLALYERGAMRQTYPIIAQASEGSFFDAPQGLYVIQGKAENHVSQIERRRFSWAIYLFGNYLIHSQTQLRPTAAGNAALVRTFSDGGIQLAPADARDLFSKVREGMPVLIAGANSPNGIHFTYFRRTNLPHRVPEVTAASALAMDLETGEILFEKNKNDAYPTASLTKLMTAVVAREAIEPEELLTISKEALATYGDSAGLVKGEVFRSADLLLALILPSSNDAAAVYAEAVPDLVNRMNEKADALGLYRTFFADASGLSRDNVTSAGDLYALLRYIDSRDPELLTLSREKIAIRTSEGKKKQHVWTNINWLRDDKRFLGGKAGFTDDSLQTMAGIWQVRVSEHGGRRVAILLLGSRSRVRDVRSLIDYLEKDFVYGFAYATDKNTSLPATSAADNSGAESSLRGAGP